jgi:hypothetical protein
LGIQKKGVAAADKNFDNYSYVDANRTTYMKVAEKGYKDEKNVQKTRRLLFLHSRSRQRNGTPLLR